ncbi:hypothetical protein [Prescottella agglutinans]|uniref:Uncharacterized protein n=1 Tax=Prescottella agglutinans TaxID=1644129 RepID=A0ABT6MEX2_9NOCA|nr:hypothetical protein [Prescottella agglutinans]MDH6282872.1 hypothetical protein [Prescottella agglutinans]
MSQDILRDRHHIHHGMGHTEAADRGIASVVKRIDGLHDTLRVVRDLHHSQPTTFDRTFLYCNECSQPWPCATIQTLNDLKEAP